MSEGQRESEIEGKEREKSQSEQERERARSCAREKLPQAFTVREEVLFSEQQDTPTSAISIRRLASVCQQLRLQQHVAVGG